MHHCPNPHITCTIHHHTTHPPLHTQHCITAWHSYYKLSPRFLQSSPVPSLWRRDAHSPFNPEATCLLHFTTYKQLLCEFPCQLSDIRRTTLNNDTTYIRKIILLLYSPQFCFCFVCKLLLYCWKTELIDAAKALVLSTYIHKSLHTRCVGTFKSTEWYSGLHYCISLFPLRSTVAKGS